MKYFICSTCGRRHARESHAVLEKLKRIGYDGSRFRSSTSTNQVEIVGQRSMVSARADGQHSDRSRAQPR